MTVKAIILWTAVFVLLPEIKTGVFFLAVARDMLRLEERIA